MTNLSENFYTIGHRGAAGEKFENSLEGFQHALKLPIDAIELDIREHSSQLWVFHDHELERLTGKAGLLEDQTDVSRLRLQNGEPVPTLQQVLDLAWGKMPLNIEIKSINNSKLLLDLLARYAAPEPASGLPWILISSFNHKTLVELKRLNCPWPLAPISRGVPHDIDLTIDTIAPYSWHFEDKTIDLKRVLQLLERGIISLVFTVNDIARARYLRAHGIAGIFTNLPSRMLHID